MNPMQQKKEMEQDIAALRNLLTPLNEVRRPLPLSAEALTRLLPGKRPEKLKRRILTSLATVAAGVVVVAGVLLTREARTPPPAAVPDAPMPASLEAGIPNALYQESAGAAFAGPERAEDTGGALPSLTAAQSYEQIAASLEAVPESAEKAGRSVMAFQSAGGGRQGSDEGPLKAQGNTLYYAASERENPEASVLYVADAPSATLDAQVSVRGSLMSEIFLSEQYVALITSENHVLETASSSVHIFDTADPKNPVLARTFTQEGIYTASREKDGILYLVTRADESAAVPCVQDSAVGGRVQLEPAQILLPAEVVRDRTFAVATALPIASIGSSAETVAVLGAGRTVHLSRDQLYLGCDIAQEESALLFRFPLEPDGFVCTAQERAACTLTGAELWEREDGALQADTPAGESILFFAAPSADARSTMESQAAAEPEMLYRLNETYSLALRSIAEKGLEASLWEQVGTAAPRRNNAVILSDPSGYSEALYDTGSFVRNEDGGWCAIPLEDTSAGSRLAVLHIREGLLEEMGSVSHTAPGVPDDTGLHRIRYGRIVGDVLYTVSASEMVATRLPAFSEIGTIALA